MPNLIEESSNKLTISERIRRWELQNPDRPETILEVGAGAGSISISQIVKEFTEGTLGKTKLILLDRDPAYIDEEAKTDPWVLKVLLDLGDSTPKEKDFVDSLEQRVDVVWGRNLARTIFLREDLLISIHKMLKAGGVMHVYDDFTGNLSRDVDKPGFLDLLKKYFIVEKITDKEMNSIPFFVGARKNKMHNLSNESPVALKLQKKELPIIVQTRV